MLPAGSWHDGWVTFRLWSMLLPLTLSPICCLFLIGIINNAVLLAHRFWHKGSEFRQTHWNGWSKLGGETSSFQTQTPSKYTNPSFPRAYKGTLLLHSPLLSSIRTLVLCKMRTHTSIWGQCFFFFKKRLQELTLRLDFIILCHSFNHLTPREGNIYFHLALIGSLQDLKRGLSMLRLAAQLWSGGFGEFSLGVRSPQIEETQFWLVDF